MSIYVNARVDEDEVLQELSTDTLMAELRQRGALPFLPDIEPPKVRECWQSLSDAAAELRRAGKVGLAYRLDEIRHDYFNLGTPTRVRARA